MVKCNEIWWNIYESHLNQFNNRIIRNNARSKLKNRLQNSNIIYLYVRMFKVSYKINLQKMII